MHDEHSELDQDIDDRLEEIEATVRHRLRTRRARSAVLHVDGRLQRVTVGADGDTGLAPGYDVGAVLEHEP